MFKQCLLFIVILLLFVDLQAQKRIYNTTKIQSEPPRIDGIISESAWDSVEWSGDFIQHEPHAKAPATQETEFKILYDNNNIYVAVRCFDSAPDSIVRRMARRDFDVGDWVKIIFDSYHDLKTGFSFGVSAAGVKIDEAITNGDNWDQNWDPIWQVKTNIDELGWTVEASIPLSQLRFSKQNEYNWGLLVGRKIYRNGEISTWEFLPANAPEIVHLFGELHGIKNIEPKKQKDLTPYIALGRQTYQREYGNPFSTGKSWITNAGIDGKFGVTNNLTLDFTINPDFGQIEADPSEVNLTTFETKFDERRPFFIEGKNILSFRILGGGGPLSNDNLFYSRRIGRSPHYWPDLDDNEYMNRPDNTSILGAFKLTGKTQKGWSVGVMESITQKEHAEIDREGERRNLSIEPMTNYFASRLQKDFNNSNTVIGGMVTTTHRKLDDLHLADELHRQAYSAGIDLFHQWKEKTYYISFTSAVSRIQGNNTAIYTTQTSAPHFFQRPDQSHMRADSALNTLNGYGGTLQYGKAGNGKWRYTIWITARSPGFNLNDIGYLNRNDEIQEVAWIGYSQREPVSIFRNFNLNANQWAATTFGLERRYFGGNINSHATFINYWSSGFDLSRDGRGISTEALRGGPALAYDGASSFFFFFQSDERKKFMFGSQNYFNWQDKHSANSQNYDLSVRFQISDAWSFSLNPGMSKNYDQLAYVETIEDWEEPRYIRGTLDHTTAQLVFRTDYSISPNLTIQVYAMPFISAGNYSDFKFITNATSRRFEERFQIYTDNQVVYNEATEVFEVYESNAAIMDYSFEQPNFNIHDFNMNLVIRWEYLPGSILYLVWSQKRFDESSAGNFRLGKNTEALFENTYPNDVLLIKLSYRLGL